MKNYIKKVFVLGFLITSSMAFAFPADPDPTVDPPAPIGDYLFVLMFLGIGLAVWFCSKKTEKI